VSYASSLFGEKRASIQLKERVVDENRKVLVHHIRVGTGKENSYRTCPADKENVYTGKISAKHW